VNNTAKVNGSNDGVDKRELVGEGTFQNRRSAKVGQKCDPGN